MAGERALLSLAALDPRLDRLPCWCAVLLLRRLRGTVAAAATSEAEPAFFGTSDGSAEDVPSGTSLGTIWNASPAAVAGPAPSEVDMAVACFFAATGARKAAKHEHLSAHTVADRLLSLPRNPSGGQPEMKEIPKDPPCPAEAAKAAPEINSKVISRGIWGVWILCRGATN